MGRSFLLEAKAPASLRRPALFGALAACAVVAGAELGGKAFISELPGAWFFGTPGGPLGSIGPLGAPPALALLLVYGGLLVMTRTWLGVMRYLRRAPGVPVRRIVGLLALWMIPLLLAPPLFSRDAYNYAGQGEMVSHHINPYQYGTGVLGATSFNLLGGTLWSNSPSPYGPLFLSVDGAVTGLTGHQELADLVALRLLALGGLALVMLAVPTLARAAKKDPAEAIVLGAGSPLVLTSLVGGLHNDALMVGLMMAGLAVAQRYGPVPGIVLCSLGAGVKSPALLAVVVIGWTWAPRGASAWTRVARTLGALGIAGAVLAAVSAVTGLGWGWTRTFDTADQVSTGVTPLSSIAHVIAGIGALIGLPLTFVGVRVVVDVVGIVLAGAVCCWLLAHSEQLGRMRTLGLMLLITALLSPVLWAWYLSWGLVSLATVASGRLRQVLVAVAVVWTFVSASAVEGILDAIVHSGALPDVLLAMGLTAMAFVPLGLDRGSRASVTAGPAPQRSATDGRSDSAIPEATIAVLGDLGAAPSSGL